MLFLILFPLAVFGQNELTFAVKEQEEHPYVVPIIGADEFASWLTSDPDLAKFVLFTVDERWCRKFKTEKFTRPLSKSICRYLQENHLSFQ